tara:strand:- start:490 stop:807 length:318 start_codon:yes stop_codon:yes gene_type:complete
MDIYALAEIAEAAQVEIQASCPLTDPIIGVSRNLRDAGFAVDVMTIDCCKSGKRITLLVNDDKPGQVCYQLGFRDRDPGAVFESVAFEQLTSVELCRWITAYFSA